MSMRKWRYCTIQLTSIVYTCRNVLVCLLAVNFVGQPRSIIYFTILPPMFVHYSSSSCWPSFLFPLPHSLLLHLLFSFSFLSSAVDHFGIIPEYKEACIKAIPRNYIIWQHAKASPDRVAYAIRSVDWLIRPCQTERFTSWIKIRSIGKAGQIRQKQWIKPSLKPPCRGWGRLPRLLHLSPPLRPILLLFPSVIFRPSFSNSTAQFKRFQMGGTLRPFHFVSPSSNDSGLLYHD